MPEQLSLFDADPPAPVAAPLPTRPPQASPGAAVSARSEPDAEPAPPAAPAPAPMSHRHPRADREIRLGECQVAYLLRRARRKSIGFIVGPEGLAVSAPRWVGQGEIEAALREKSGWILRKLAEQRDRQRRVEAARVEWRDGASLPFLGETVILVLDPRVAGAVLNTDAEALPGVPRLTLHIGLPQTAQPAQICDVVQSWLQRQARRIFEERCAHFAPRLGVRVARLRLSSAQTRWGSASADGAIHLNWRLVHFGLPVIDYVVAHELAHLREMNHSAAFWDVVRSVIPDLEHRKAELRDPVLPVFS
ncbi:MAG: SprT family zinc-dependent metalloprotease [Burkholderiaceae bacterium]